MAANPTTIVFDLGGVLIDWDPRHLYRKMFSDTAAMEYFLAEICTIEWIHEQDAGRPFSEGIPLLAARHPDYAEYIEAYWSRWPEMITGAIDGSVEILHSLKARGTPLYALSNWSVETWPLARGRFAFLDLFDGMVISGFEGAKKPDSRIYRILFDRHAIAPGDSVFIDDRLDNVRAAQALGMTGVHFTGPDTLEAALKAMRLL